MSSYVGFKEDWIIGCSTPFTSSSFVFGFSTLYNAKLTQANPTTPLTTAIAYVFNPQATILRTSNAAPTLPARIACLYYVNGLSFSFASLLDLLLKHADEERALEAFSVSVGVS